VYGLSGYFLSVYTRNYVVLPRSWSKTIVSIRDSEIRRARLNDAAVDAVYTSEYRGARSLSHLTVYRQPMELSKLRQWRWLRCIEDAKSSTITRNVLDYDQSNYSSRIIFSYRPTFTLEPNTNRTGWTVSEIWPFKIMQDGWQPWSWIWSNRK